MVAEYIKSGCNINSDVERCYSYGFSANDNEEYYYYDYNSTYMDDHYEDNEEYHYYDYNSTYMEDYYDDYYEYCYTESVLGLAVYWNSTNFIRTLIEVYIKRN